MGVQRFLPTTARSDYLALPETWYSRVHMYPRHLRYGVALLSVLVAYDLKEATRLWLRLPGGEAPFIFFFGSVLISSWFGGIGAGVFATILSFLLADYFYIDRFTLFANSPADTVLLGIFVFEGFLISAFMQNLHVALRRSEQQRISLLQTEARFQLIFDNLKDYALMTLNCNGLITGWSPGARRLFGYEESEVIGTSFSIIFSPPDNEQKLPQEELNVAIQQGRCESERWLVRKDGTAFWGSGVTTSAIDLDGNVLALIKVVGDESNRKLSEQRKDEFISTAGHEIKTPITTIRTYIEILRRLPSTQDDDRVQSYLEKLNHQSERLSDLVNELLDVSKIQSGKVEYRFEPIRIDEIIKDVLSDFCDIHPSFLVEFQAQTSVKVNVDRFRIMQVLVNLLNNAVRYSPDTNRIIVSAEEKQDYVQIGVTDFGVGIPEEEKAKIFERFFRGSAYALGREKGLGLGLYISSEIVRNHQGRFWVESEVGKGSTFYFSLPYA